ncbi:MAG: 4-hydroxy-3-methylbut-2-enyl diphosphate reductase, partial [Elusimicrobiales bacterium]
MIDIRVAESAGFCPGVNAAIEKVIELASNGNKRIYTLGQLIHNNDIIKELEKRGIKAIDDPLQITDPQNSILVIRAHGIPPEVEEEIRSKNIEIVDATCPLVKKVHKIITEYRKKGYRTVIFGDHKHAEVIGLKGYAGDDGIVVSSIEEVEKLPFMEKVNFVSQTTQQEEIFIEAAKILQKKTKDLVISDTICQPTKKRQKETIALAKESDLTIVVGGKHSANTKRLFDICSRLS